MYAICMHMCRFILDSHTVHQHRNYFQLYIAYTYLPLSCSPKVSHHRSCPHRCPPLCLARQLSFPTTRLPSLASLWLGMACNNSDTESGPHQEWQHLVQNPRPMWNLIGLSRGDQGWSGVIGGDQGWSGVIRGSDTWSAVGILHSPQQSTNTNSILQLAEISFGSARFMG